MLFNSAECILIYRLLQQAALRLLQAHYDSANSGTFIAKLFKLKKSVKFLLRRKFAELLGLLGSKPLLPLVPFEHFFH